MAVRQERLRGELTQRFAAEWRLAYRDALAHAAQAVEDAASAQEQLASIWALGGEHTAATPQMPGPLPSLRLGHPSIAMWLAAVRTAAATIDA